MIPGEEHDADKLRLTTGAFWPFLADTNQLWQDLADLFARIKPDFDPTPAAARQAWKDENR